MISLWAHGVAVFRGDFFISEIVGQGGLRDFPDLPHLACISSPSNILQLLRRY